jgi:dihydropyrimidine dehydrogenase (NAD+) subunit PreA
VSRSKDHADLSVDFCGLHFENPFILSAGPPTSRTEMIRKGFDAGWAGAVVKTFKTVPTPNVSPRFARVSSSEGGIVGFVNIELSNEYRLEDELPKIRRLKRDYPDRVVLAGIMAGMESSEWQGMARKLEEVGVDMLEMALWCPGGKTGTIGEDPEAVRDVVRWVKESVGIPVSVKLAPNVTDIALIAKAAEEGGADAVSATDSVPCFMGVDLERMEPLTSVRGRSAFGGYSGPAIKPIVLRHVVQIAKSTKLPISGIGGISSWRDAAEYLMVGASTLQVCTAVMFSGYRIIDDLTEGLSNYLVRKGFGSVREIVGSVLPKVVDDVGRLDLSYKVFPQIDSSLCVRCGLCYVACRDGGYQAIELDGERLPMVDEEKCAGCSLCAQVCPVWGCVEMRPKKH